MRPLLPLAAFVLCAATACTVEPLPDPPEDPLAERLSEQGYEPESSEISPDEELLCLPADDGDACEEPGELRWSLPLEGDHHLTEEHGLHRLGAGPMVPPVGRHDPLPVHALTTVAGLLHVENHWLRMLDADTGETLWRKDLMADEGGGLARDGLRSVHATDDHILLNYVSGLVRIDPDGEVVDHFAEDSCIGPVLGATEDAVALDECGDTRYPKVFDPATGEREESVVGDLPEEVDGTLLPQGRDTSPDLPWDDSFSRLETDLGDGPQGLLTRMLEETDTLMVGQACAPDGLGEASPAQPAPGIPCEDPRLYAVNT